MPSFDEELTMKRTAIFLMLLTMGAVFPVPTPSILGDAGIACAADDWRSEFDELCSKTTDAMGLSTDELKGLADRCDRLQTRIEQLEETERKVFLKRLRMCRDLYRYVIDSRTKQ